MFTWKSSSAKEFSNDAGIFDHSNVIRLDDYRRRRSPLDQISPAHAPVVSTLPGPPLPWRESRRGNLYTTTARFHCVVYPVGRAWGYRITERTTEQGAYGPGRFYSQNEAVAAAEEALGDFERDPRAGVSPQAQFAFPPQYPHESTINQSITS
jgi:hypothetical protein